MRAQLVKIRSMQGFQVRSLTYEFGVAAPKSWRALLAQVAPLLADPTRCPVPELVRVELLNQLEGLRTLTARMLSSNVRSAAGSVARRSVSGWPRSQGSAGLRPRRWSQRWLMRAAFAPGESLPPSWAWYRGSRAPVGG